MIVSKLNNGRFWQLYLQILTKCIYIFVCYCLVEYFDMFNLVSILTHIRLIKEREKRNSYHSNYCYVNMSMLCRYVDAKSICKCYFDMFLKLNYLCKCSSISRIPRTPSFINFDPFYSLIISCCLVKICFHTKDQIHSISPILYTIFDFILITLFGEHPIWLNHLLTYLLTYLHQLF